MTRQYKTYKPSHLTALVWGLVASGMFLAGGMTERYSHKHAEAVRDLNTPVASILVEQCGVMAGLFLVWNDRPLSWIPQDGDTDFSGYVETVKRSRFHAFKFHVPCPEGVQTQAFKIVPSNFQVAVR